MGLLKRIISARMNPTSKLTGLPTSQWSAFHEKAGKGTNGKLTRYQGVSRNSNDLRNGVVSLPAAETQKRSTGKSGHTDKS